MCHFKYLLLLLCAACFNSCKPPYYSFKTGDDITPEFFKELPRIVSGIKTNNNKSLELKEFKSVDVFTATFTEYLVERDAIPEFKLMNEESENQTSKMVDRLSYGGSNILKLYIINEGLEPSFCIYLAMGQDVHGKCHSLGPVYLGLLRFGYIKMLYELEIKKCEKGYFITDKKELADMFWYMNVDSLSEKLDRFHFTRIDYNLPSKISGRKTTIYNIARIFNDSTALTFVRDE